MNFKEAELTRAVNQVKEQLVPKRNAFYPNDLHKIAAKVGYRMSGLQATEALVTARGGYQKLQMMGEGDVLLDFDIKCLYKWFQQNYQFLRKVNKLEEESVTVRYP